jgi:hypothetical protein
MIPIASPAFPAVLMPVSNSEDCEVEVEVDVAEAVLDRVEATVALAVARGIVLSTVDEPAKMTEARELDEELSWTCA